jgi:cytochrome b
VANSDVVRVWDLPLRLFHWLLVAAIAGAFLSSEEGSPINQWHIAAGWVVAILIVFRIVWGFVGGTHSRFSDFVRPSRIGAHLREMANGKVDSPLGHNPLGGIAVILILALCALTVWSGAFGGEGTEDLHELLAWSLLALVVIHVVAVVLMSFVQRESLIRAMVTGNRSARQHPNAKNARSPRLLAWLIAAITIVATTYAVIRYDPMAFSPRSTEGAERGNGHGDSESSGAERDD